jgi:hypothetical protein
MKNEIQRRKFENALLKMLIVNIAALICLLTIASVNITKYGIQIEFTNGTGYWIENNLKK